MIHVARDQGGNGGNPAPAASGAAGEAVAGHGSLPIAVSNPALGMPSSLQGLSSQQGQASECLSLVSQAMGTVPTSGLQAA